MGWNFGDILEAVEPVIPDDRPAFAHGERVIPWGDLKRRSSNLARAMIAAGAQPRDKCAIYMRNRPEYLEGLAAAWKARLTHVNVNYRYTPEEVFYIFDNADATVVLYGAEFRDCIAQIRDRLPGVKLFLEAGGEGSASAPEWAVAYEAAAEDGDGSPLRLERSPQDEFFIYTGGTTGMPKGVVWTHDDMREIGLQAARKLGPVPETLEQLVAATAAAPVYPIIACGPPLMHGTGLLTSMNAMLAGGLVATLPSASFRAEEMLDAIDRWKATTAIVVGDAFARPLLEALDAEPGRWDVSSVQIILSSGVMWSVEVKRGLLRHMPGAVMQDAFSSSEAIGMGVSLMTKDGETPTAKFTAGDRCKVFDEHDREVAPGSGVSGIVGLMPPNPLAYYKDPEKTAKTFREIGGVRYSFPGDYALVEADGTLTLLGRGSVCINTAGEKVFPEEVEEALKTHPSVADALVVGLPDPAWGQSVTGVVELRPGQALDEEALRRHVRQSLAGYKAPKRIVTGDVTLRAPNGKADYKAASAFAARAVGEPQGV